MSSDRIEKQATEHLKSLGIIEEGGPISPSAVRDLVFRAFIKGAAAGRRRTRDDAQGYDGGHAVMFDETRDDFYSPTGDGWELDAQAVIAELLALRERVAKLERQRKPK